MSLHRHVTIGQVGRGIADASLGKQKTAVCEGKKTEGTSWTDFSEEDALFGSGGPGLGGSLFEIDRKGLWCLLVPQREEVPAPLVDGINKIINNRKGCTRFELILKETAETDTPFLFL